MGDMDKVLEVFYNNDMNEITFSFNECYSSGGDHSDSGHSSDMTGMFIYDISYIYQTAEISTS